MYQSGNVDVRVLKDILGHEQLNTTQIYTHISNEHMEKAMAQNPLADISRRDKVKWSPFGLAVMILLFVTGVIMESYINPVLMKMFLKTV